mmetsp:Transcript_15049/g.41670  ORF Transcript_15049/g.41670 Transcript_15049/m.41670 type:complete len:223 (-) Transcript_15049:350-1018(-)
MPMSMSMSIIHLNRVPCILDESMARLMHVLDPRIAVGALKTAQCVAQQRKDGRTAAIAAVTSCAANQLIVAHRAPRQRNAQAPACMFVCSDYESASHKHRIINHIPFTIHHNVCADAIVDAKGEARRSAVDRRLVIGRAGGRVVVLTECAGHLALGREGFRAVAGPRAGGTLDALRSVQAHVLAVAAIVGLQFAGESGVACWADAVLEVVVVMPCDRFSDLW